MKFRRARASRVKSSCSRSSVFPSPCSFAPIDDETAMKRRWNCRAIVTTTLLPPLEFQYPSPSFRSLPEISFDWSTELTSETRFIINEATTRRRINDYQKRGIIDSLRFSLPVLSSFFFPLFKVESMRGEMIDRWILFPFDVYRDTTTNPFRLIRSSPLLIGSISMGWEKKKKRNISDENGTICSVKSPMLSPILSLSPFSPTSDIFIVRRVTTFEIKD